jgi:serine/threonine protein kinase
MENMLLNDKKTLAQRLSEGRLPVAEALRYAMQLADCLRKLHDTGKVHGAVTPSNLVLAAGGVELLPAAEGWGEAITPYTAPEVVQGRPADASSDVFGFGAILFEMMTGRRAFDGESRVALAANLTETPAPSSGSPIVDRLVGPCLNKNPDARSPRMRKVMLELKVLMVAVRRAAPGAGGTPRRCSNWKRGWRPVSRSRRRAWLKCIARQTKR